MRTMAGMVLGLVMLVPLPAMAAELVMLHQPGCAWCLRFEAEIGAAYPKTQQAAVAPLRRVDITKAWPEDLRAVAPERFTPSFVLVHDGREVSRMRGYAGDQFFWFLLDEMIAKLPPDAATPLSPEG
ncbi:transcriptional regulator [Aestuariivirga sp.]|uniref:transcriptional regulator n=1 Tax=Aestuariivirga sp. TaxID=2650926 RepID=UPI0035937425